MNVLDLFLQGDAISRGVALTLLAMSVCSWVAPSFSAISWNDGR